MPKGHRHGITHVQCLQTAAQSQMRAASALTKCGSAQRGRSPRLEPPRLAVAIKPRLRRPHPRGRGRQQGQTGYHHAQRHGVLGHQTNGALIKRRGLLLIWSMVCLAVIMTMQDKVRRLMPRRAEDDLHAGHQHQPAGHMTAQTSHGLKSIPAQGMAWLSLTLIVAGIAVCVVLDSAAKRDAG